MRILVLALLLFAAMVAVPRFDRALRPIHAGLALEMDLEDLVREAGVVLEGRVLAAQADAPAAERIETEYAIQVEQAYFGTAPGLMHVRLPGGVLEDGRGLLLAGMPRFEQGERVLLFLSEIGDTGVRMPVGLAQGKFRVVERGGRTLLERDAADLCLFGVDGREHASETEPGVFDYADFRARLEAALQRKRAGPELPAPTAEAR